MAGIDANELSSLDLNLLWALHVLLEEGSVTAAAARLHVGQSAVSNQLARLRELFGDPLLVRNGRGLVRTPRALELRAPLAQLVAQMAALVSGREFVASESARRFVLACDDAIEACDVPSIQARMRKQLPRASLRVMSVDRLVQAGGLASGEVDLALGPKSAFGEAHFSPLFKTGALFAMRRDHPEASKRWTPALFNRLSFIDTWIANGEPGVGHQAVRAQMAAHGFVPNVALIVSHFGAAASAAAATDLVAGLPERLARHYARFLPLALKPFPAPLRFELELGMAWHARTDQDPGSRFFRALVQRTLAR